MKIAQLQQGVLGPRATCLMAANVSSETNEDVARDHPEFTNPLDSGVRGGLLHPSQNYLL